MYWVISLYLSIIYLMILIVDGRLRHSRHTGTKPESPDKIETFVLPVDERYPLYKFYARNESAQYELLMSLFNRGYNKHVRPNGDLGVTTPVTVDIRLNNIGAVNEITMDEHLGHSTQDTLKSLLSKPLSDYMINIYLRQRWQDRRLSFRDIHNETLVLPAAHLDKLWLPDLFIVEEKKSTFHVLTTPNRGIWIDPDGNIVYSQRLTLLLHCAMDFINYPHDGQECFMHVESYVWTSHEMTLDWTHNKKEVEIGESSNVDMPEFKLVKTATKKCQVTTSLGAFPCVVVDFILERQHGYYMTQTYIPSMLVVMLSWVSFWIDHRAVPARISLGLLTVLTMTTQNSGINNRLPRVSYVKAIDVWLSACLMFVFGALLEYAVVNVLSRNISKKDKDDEHHDEKDDEISDKDTARLMEMPGAEDLPERKGKETEKTGEKLANSMKDSVESLKHRHPHFPATIHVNVRCTCKVKHPQGHPHYENHVEKNSVPIDDERTSVIGDEDDDIHNRTPLSWKQKLNPIRLLYRPITAETVDFSAKIIFPASFVAFNLFYWFTYQKH